MKQEQHTKEFSSRLPRFIPLFPEIEKLKHEKKTEIWKASRRTDGWDDVCDFNY